MGSLNSIKIREKMRNGMTERIVADGPIAFRIRYVGDYSVTSVVVITGTNIILTPSTGTAVTCTFATYTTMGAAADFINNSDDWDCELLDALRSDASVSVLINGAISAGSAGFYDATIDTSATDSITYRCTYDRTEAGNDRPQGAHRVHLKSFIYYATLGGAAANDVQIWEYDPVAQSETQVYQALSVNNTDTTIQFASGEGWITSGWGNDLIVRLEDNTSIADASLYLEVSYDRE